MITATIKRIFLVNWVPGGLFLLLAAAIWWIRFGDTPSHRIFASSSLNQIVLRARMPVWKSGDRKKPGGMLAISSVNGMLTMDASFADVLSQWPLTVWMHRGNCALLGEKQYVLAPTSAGASVWWTSLYEFSWRRLMAELPLALTFRSLDGRNTVYYCADILLTPRRELL